MDRGGAEAVAGGEVSERKTIKYPSGFERGVEDGKVMAHLVYDGPMLDRYAKHLTGHRDATTESNWLKAETPEEMARFRRSAARHFHAWMRGDQDEDHAAALWFNINGYEHVRTKLEMAEARAMYAEVEAELAAEATCVPPVAEKDLPASGPVEGKVYMLKDGTLVKAVRGASGGCEEIADANAAACWGSARCKGWPSGRSDPAFKRHYSGDIECLYLVVQE